MLGRPSLDPEGGSHGTRHINIAGSLVTPGPAPVVLRALQDAVRVRARLMRLPPEEGRVMVRFLDFFAGFGGASSGLVEAGFELVSAYNHWDRAIEVHSANHRDADHVQGDLSGYDMRRLPRGAEVLWASPECTWHSPAGGRAHKPRDTMLDLFDDYVPNAAAERSRATMWDPIRAAEARDFPVVLVENVVEVARWPLFEVWLKAWEALGYSWQIVNASAAHVHSDRNAPAGQWRDRIYIALAKGVELPDLAPRPPAYCPQCDQTVRAVQTWKRERHIQVGKYGPQYFYSCPSRSHSAQQVEPYTLPASAVIDWSDLGTRIGDRKRKLSAATMRRVEMGARMYARPMVVAHSGQTWDAAKPGHPAYGQSDGYYRAWAADAAPLMTRQAGGTGDAIAVPPYSIAVNHGGHDGRAQRLDSGPLPTRSTKIGDGLAFPPFVTTQYGHQKGDEYRNRPIEYPLGTVVAGGAHQALVSPPYMVELYGTSTARDVEQPLGTITAGGNKLGLAVPPDAPMGAPVGMVTPIRERPTEVYEGELPFALDDVRFRMLGPKEHLKAQRFWDDYDTSAANKSETTMGAGNAVAVNVAHHLGALVLAALDGKKETTR